MWNVEYLDWLVEKIIYISIKHARESVSFRWIPRNKKFNIKYHPCKQTFPELISGNLQDIVKKILIQAANKLAADTYLMNMKEEKY